MVRGWRARLPRLRLIRRPDDHRRGRVDRLVPRSQPAGPRDELHGLRRRRRDHHGCLPDERCGDAEAEVGRAGHLDGHIVDVQHRAVAHRASCALIRRTRSSLRVHERVGRPRTAICCEARAWGRHGAGNEATTTEIDDHPVGDHDHMALGDDPATPGDASRGPAGRGAAIVAAGAFVLFLATFVSYSCTGARRSLPDVDQGTVGVCRSPDEVEPAERRTHGAA